MKKTITLLVLAISFISCRKSDDSEKQLPVNYTTISGKWYFSQYVLPNGNLSPHVGYCQSNRDYIEITEFPRILTTIYYPDCISRDPRWCNDFFLHPLTNTISNCNYLFNGKVVELTANRMRIDYPQTIFIPDTPIGDAKGIVFSRQ